MRNLTPLRIGVALGSESVRAIGVRGDAVAWTLEGPLPAGEDRGRRLAAFLLRLPIPRWPRVKVNVAVGPAHAQAKRLSGLPRVDDVALLTRVVSEGAGRFFLRNGVPLMTTHLRVDAPGEIWGAAFERPLVEEVAKACRAAKLTLGVLVPTVSVLPRALVGRSVQWTDEQITVVVDSREARMTGVRRTAATASFPEPAPVPVPALAALGDSAIRFADAYGAALVGRHEPLFLKPAPHANAAPIPRWRMAIAAAALVMAASAALAAPVISSRRESARAASRLRALAGPRRAAASIATDLRRVSAVLDEAAAFERTRRSTTLLLAGLTRVLPDGSALSTIRMDSTTATLVAFAPRAGAVLAALEHLYQVTTPEIVGPVTKELVAGRELERATIRFRLRPLSMSSQPTPAPADRSVR